MGFCENCGNKLPEDAAFCENCGAPVPQDISNIEKETIQEAPQPAEADNAAPELPPELPHEVFESAAEESAVPPNRRERKPKKKGKRFLIAVILLALLAGGGYFWQNQQKEAAPKTIASSEKTKPSTKKKTATTSSSEKTETSKEPPKGQLDKTKIGQISDETIGKLANETSVYVVDPRDRSNHYAKNGGLPIRAASVIKLYLMEAFYNEVAEGTILLEQPYVLKDVDKVGGTGVLQDYAEGTKLTYEKLVRHMMIDSDNTAGNIILNILGGPEHATELIKGRGYKQTRLERKFVDADALAAGQDNYTSAADVGELLAAIYQKKAVSPQYDQQMLDILKANKDHSKLPKNIDGDPIIYNKTGEYAEYGVQNDACIIEQGEQALIAVVLSQDGEETAQVHAMNQFGNKLYHTFREEG